MSVYLTGVTATGGIPFFSRSLGGSSTGDSPPSSIPFSTMAALNGVNLFARLNEANLLATQTKDTQIQWKVYDSTIVLIIIVTRNQTDSATSSPLILDSIDPSVIDNCLDNIYKSLILFSGKKGIEATGRKSNLESLKDCVKVSLVLIDYLLRMLLTTSLHPNLRMSVANSLFMQSSVKDFVKDLAESYCTVTSSDLTCVIVNGFIVSASKGWWNRLSSSSDSFLLVTLVNALSSSISNDTEVKSREVTVFLPDKCPDDETRLIVSEVYPTVFLVVLCGSEPSFESIIEIVSPLTHSEFHKQQFQKLHCLRGGTSSCILPIDDRITSFALVRKHQRTLLKYGNFDQIKMKELLTAFIVMIPDEKQEIQEQYLKFKKSTAFLVSSLNLILIVFVSNDYPLKVVQSIANKTLKQLSDKKFLSQVN